MLALYICEIDVIINIEQFNKLLSIMPSEKQEKIMKYRFDIDKKLSLYSQLLIRNLICKILCIRNDDISFKIGKHGKPNLKGYKNFHFNISHTRNMIAVAISDTKVGVDVERFKKAEMNIAKRFFTENEFLYINKSEKNKNNLFFEVWTKKEAYVKFVGKGLSHLLKSFNVLSKEYKNLIYTFEKNGYIISVCCANINTLKVIQLSEKDISDFYLL